MAEKLSVKLNAMLDEKDRNTVAGLFDFTDKLEEFYNKAACTPEQRESIANKELNITYLVEQIVKVKNKHISNEEKKNQIQELLNGVDIEYLIEEVKAEIEKVRSLMLDKAKDASDELRKQFGTLEVSCDKLIDGSIETEEEKVEDAEAKKKKILEEEKEKDQNKEETQMIEYEENGFWAKFSRIREEGKTEKGKKTGIFKSLFMAGKEYLQENKEIREKQREASMSDEEKAANAEAEKIAEEMNAIDEQIKASKENIKKLKQQKKDLKGRLLEACEKAIEAANDTYKKSIEPIPEAEITEERCASIFERIAAFREGRREARHQKAINKLEGKIEKGKEDIKEITSEIKEHSAQREQVVSGIIDGKEVEVDRKVLDKDINYEIKAFGKMTKKVQKLEAKKTRENEKYAQRSSRSGGMDR